MARPKSIRQPARLSVSLDGDDYQALKELAERNEVSTAWLVRRAVTDFLRRSAGQESTLLPIQANDRIGDRR